MHEGRDKDYLWTGFTHSLCDTRNTPAVEIEYNFQKVLDAGSKKKLRS